MATFVYPPISVTASSGPVQYNLNGSATTVSQDTATPANSRPLPVVNLNSSGAAVDPATSQKQDTGNTSLASIDSKTPALVGGNQPVTVQAAVVPSDVGASGTLGNLGDNVVVSSSGEGTAIFEITATSLVGTVTIEASNNAFTSMTPVATVYLNGLAPQSATWVNPAVGAYSSLAAGFKQIRIRVSAYTSGTASILANASMGNRITVALQGNPNNLQTLATQGPAGAVAWKVDGSGVTQPVSGTVTVQQATAANLNATVTGTVAATQSGVWTVQPGNTQNTTAWLTKDSSNGSVAAGTAASFSSLSGGVFNTTLPTLTTGQQAAVQLDSSGRQILGTSAAVIGAVTQSGTWNVGTVTAVTAITNALPAGTNVIGFVKQGGKSLANAPVYNDYGTTNVTTAAYVQLVASLTSAVTEVEIHDTGGNALYFATGASGSEVVQAIMPPGGNGRIPLAIAAGTRVAVKAVAVGNSTAGSFLIVNFYN